MFGARRHGMPSAANGKKMSLCLVSLVDFLVSCYPASINAWYTTIAHTQTRRPIPAGVYGLLAITTRRANIVLLRTQRRRAMYLQTFYSLPSPHGNPSLPREHCTRLAAALLLRSIPAITSRHPTTLIYGPYLVYICVECPVLTSPSAVYGVLI